MQQHSFFVGFVICGTVSKEGIQKAFQKGSYLESSSIVLPINTKIIGTNWL